MSAETKAGVAASLAQSNQELSAMARMVDDEIASVATAFEGLAGHTDTLLKLASALIACVEGEAISSVLPMVQTLGAAAKGFIEERLQATTGILETVTTEANLLHQLLMVTSGQAAIASKINALSYLTNIEVARLGSVGAGFHYLAHELSDFSRSVIKDTRELARQTARRRREIEDTKGVLSAELPRQREALARIEADLGDAVAAVERSLNGLARTPLQFKLSLEDIARQVAGVVAAIQAHDITRQQIEHVQEAFALITSIMPEPPGDGATSELVRVSSGLTIQAYQLRTIRETVANWAAQIKTCMNGIMQVSTSEIVGIGPMVLEQERDVSSQLAQIERLELETQAYSGRIQSNLGGLQNVMQLVSEYLQKSKFIGNRLRLVAFNSIIEASQLGTQADVILAISKSITEVSAEWNGITDQSELAMQEILKLVKQTNDVMKVFSEASDGRLREAQMQNRDCLESLRTAAAAAAQQARDMEAATERMQRKSAQAGNSVDLLEACFGRIDLVVDAIEDLRRRLEMDHPAVKVGSCDAAEIERLFSASYSTEIERTVLHAALGAKAVPVAQPTFAGNSVELF